MFTTCMLFCLIYQDLYASLLPLPLPFPPYVRSFHCHVLLCLQEENRRFRIQFSAIPPATSVDSCREFVAAIAHLIPVKELGSAVPLSSSQANEPLLDSQASYEDSQSHDKGTGSCLRQASSKGTSAGTGLQSQNVDVVPSDSELVSIQQRAQVHNECTNVK